jgi:CRISPR-associated protein Csx10
MRRIDFQVRTLSPLYVGQLNPTGLYGTTRPYLPGAAVRGALAEVLLATGSRPPSGSHEQVSDADAGPYDQVFGDGRQPLFHNAYPIAVPGGGPSYPIPLTALTCRSAPGFYDPTEPEEHHGVFDHLIALTAREEALGLWEEGSRRSLLDPPERECPICGDKTAPLDGFFEGTLEEGFARAQAPIRRRSQTAVNRSRSTAAEALLYTQETVVPNTYLRGSVLVDAQQARLIKDVLPQIKALGRGRSRGLGQVLIEIKPPTSGSGVLQRVKAFNERFHAARKSQRDDVPESDAEWFFTLDLLSDTQFTCRGLPCALPQPTEWGLPAGAGVKLVRAFTHRRTAGGWVVGARLPRRTAPAAIMGSVLLYRVRGVPMKVLEPVLSRLEDQGLGTERERGYGQVIICLPLHLKERKEP